MKLDNQFSEETRWLFHERRFRCAECGGNGQDCGGTSLHHIRGRISSSPLNAIVLCGDCHAVIGHTFPEESKYLQITIRDLLRQDYKLTEDDVVFYNENIKYYE